MLQAALLDCPFLDLFPFSENGFVAPEVDVCRCDVVQALVVTLIVVILDERADLAFEITGEGLVLQQNPVLHGLMPAFDLALGLRMEWRAALLKKLLAHCLPISIGILENRIRCPFYALCAYYIRWCAIIFCILPDKKIMRLILTTIKTRTARNGNAT